MKGLFWVEILKYCNWQRKVLGGLDFNSSGGLFNNDIPMDNISFSVMYLKNNGKTKSYCWKKIRLFPRTCYKDRRIFSESKKRLWGLVQCRDKYIIVYLLLKTCGVSKDAPGYRTGCALLFAQHSFH